MADFWLFTTWAGKRILVNLDHVYAIREPSQGGTDLCFDERVDARAVRVKESFDDLLRVLDPPERDL